jgi:hypothetical protein
MQLKWDSTTTYPNIEKEQLVLQVKYPKLCILSMYIMYVTLNYQPIFCVFSTIFSFSTYWFNAWTISALSMELWRYIPGVTKSNEYTPKYTKHYIWFSSQDIHIKYSQGEIIFLLSWKTCLSVVLLSMVLP